eukprot:668825-Pelagomonas_calceolata.AAC.1
MSFADLVRGRGGRTSPTGKPCLQQGGSGLPYARVFGSTGVVLAKKPGPRDSNFLGNFLEFRAGFCCMLFMLSFQARARAKSQAEFRRAKTGTPHPHRHQSPH